MVNCNAECCNRKDHAEWLMSATSGLKAMTKADKDYVKFLRTEMEELRDLFNAWVK